MNEIEILKKNVRDLQEQLRNAYVRIKQLQEEIDKNKPDKGLQVILKMNKNRERRLKATGKWFKKTKKKSLWINNIFPIILFVSFLFYLISL